MFEGKQSGLFYGTIQSNWRRDCAFGVERMKTLLVMRLNPSQGLLTLNPCQKRSMDENKIEKDFDPKTELLKN